MAVRNYVRDKQGRFSSKGGGVVSRAKQERPQPKGGSMTRALRRGQTELYKAEQVRAQGLMKISGGGSVAGLRLIRGGIRRGVQQGASTAVGSTGRTGRVSDALRGTLQNLAQSDARYFRGVAQMTGGSTGGKKAIKGTPKRSRRQLPGS
jgi:hypothetical protein